MICYCGKPTWDYAPGVLTCKDGHHTLVKGAVVERIAPPPGWKPTVAVPPPAEGGVVYRFPRRVAFLAGAAGAVVAELLNLLF